MPVYFNEKTKKYYAAFYYTDWQGNRKKKKKEGFALARDAKAFEQDFLTRIAGDCSMKFDALLTYYLEDYKTRHKQSAYIVAYTSMKRHLLPAFGKMSLNDITPIAIRKWQNGIIDQGYSPKYQHWLSVSLSTLLNYAVKYYGLKSNPARIAGTIGSGRSNKMNFWTVDEFNQFLAVLRLRKINEHSAAYDTAFNVLFFTGIRLGELLALSIKDYDPKERTLHINKTLARGIGAPVLQAPKTQTSNRFVTLPQTLCKMLDDYIKTIYEPQPLNRLFFPITDKRLRYVFYKTIANAGLKKIRVHDLRHSHASLLIEMGASPLAISERLGHKNVQTTLNVYSHLYPNKAAEIANNLDKLIVH